MDSVAIVDTETTGLDPKLGTCIEVAVVRYSVSSQAMIDCFSTLITADGNPIEQINHIPGQMLRRYGMEPSHAWEQVADICQLCDVVLAHNADFDRQWLPPGFPETPPWIDTCQGIRWPMESKPGSNLISLCLDHGIGVIDPHRALNDCLMLSRLLTRVAQLGFDLTELLEMGLRPMALFQAVVSYADRKIAKEHGFKWEEAPLKRWVRKLAIEDAKLLPFKTVRVVG